MSAPGHCRHCVGGCVGGQRAEPCPCEPEIGPQAVFHRHTNAKGVDWMDRCCPYCDEAERIADAIYERVQATADSVAFVTDKYHAGYVSALNDVAALIARGDA